MRSNFTRRPSRGGGHGRSGGFNRDRPAGGDGNRTQNRAGPRDGGAGFARRPSGASRTGGRDWRSDRASPPSELNEAQLKKFNVIERKLDRRSLFTRNITPGKSFFSERLIYEDGFELREWDVTRSKLAAAIKKGISQIGIKEGDKVLYLGASHGYTPSFVSDMVGKDGFVFCLDVAPRVVRDLVFVCEARENMAPLLADANHPESFKDLVIPEFDVIFQDIAQKNQVEIFLKNCNAYLKKGGFGLLAIKARSVDVTRYPKEIYAQVRQELEKHITVVDYRELDPFERDHAFFVCKKK